jgi:pilus assembly protein CpaC
VIGERVHLKVRPEVSVLDFNNAVVFSGFRIPALTTRRTETELELGNGQTFAIAGLLNNSMTQTLSRVPGIGDIPILGYLFRSKAARKDQTELVVMITPQILEQGSFGVTNQLPRLQEPYMPRLQENESLPNPPAPFTGTGK